MPSSEGSKKQCYRRPTRWRARCEQRGLLGHNFAVTAEEVVLVRQLAAGGDGGGDPIRRCCGAPSPGRRSQAVPVPVIAVLLVFWWGFDFKLVVIALIASSRCSSRRSTGRAWLDPDEAGLLRTLDASRWQGAVASPSFRRLPAALSGADRVAVGDRGLHAPRSTPSQRRLPRARARDPDAGGFLEARRVRRHGTVVRLLGSSASTASPGRTAARAVARGPRRGVP
jgi:hypothetical protein